MILALVLLPAIVVSAQSDKYAAAMKKNLDMFDSAKTTADFQSVSAAFERIGDAEKTQWLPYYYAGLSLTMPGWTDTKLDKDANAEKIKALCDKADALAQEIQRCQGRTQAQAVLFGFRHGQEEAHVIPVTEDVRHFAFMG